ncbi:MAG: alanine racemase [Spirochaetaceae bacterium]|nr:MAG: alanine racemase [Spirochaetaceae bacterium]
MSTLVWIELDRGAPDHNLRELRRGLKKGTILCAVVKANAYGHGVKEMVPLLPSADWFAVNSLEEGIELRELGEKRPVLILGHVPLAMLEEAVRRKMDLTVYNRETVEALARMDAQVIDPVRLHLKVETGTGRQGILPEQVEGFLERLKTVPGANLVGLSTHFANIEDTLNHDYAQFQLDRFRQVLDVLDRRKLRPEFIHTAATAAAILFEKTHFNLVRAGIGIYGLWPSRETYLSTLLGHRPVPDLRPVLAWKTRLVQIKDLPEGSYIGYGCTYRATRPIRVGVLPVGYADGYDRKLGNSAYVLIRGKRAPVIGRVCMNLTMVDISDIPQAGLEEEVVLLGRNGEERISAEAMAEWAGTINYEIVTRISPCLPRKLVG